MYVPGGVPQHMLRSSMCWASRPMNQAPSETSSLAYLCNIGLHKKIQIIIIQSTISIKSNDIGFFILTD